jgi:branched-chain amino acid transport system substrate-binding protein
MWMALMLLLVLTVAACQQQPQIEPTVRPTLTPSPIPTETPIAVETPQAEATAEATVEPTAAASAKLPPAAARLYAAAPDGKVVIGLSAGLSGEGIAPLGLDIQRGVELALQDRPYVTVDGARFSLALDVQDDLCSPDGAQMVAARFASDSTVVGVIGPMCSGGCRAAAPLFDAAEYITISPSCTAADLTTNDFLSFNRTVISDAYQGVIAAEYIYRELGVSRLATIHDGSSYGEGLVNVVAERFRALGGVVVSETALMVDNTDFRPLLDEIAEDNPEMIYFGGFPVEAARLAEQRFDVGIERIMLMGADGILSPEFIALAGTSAQGVYASSAIPPRSPLLDLFLQRYRVAYGEAPPAPFHAHAYDAVNLLLNGIEAVGQLDDSGRLIVDTQLLGAYVRSFQDYPGLTGTLNADGSGETSTANIGIAQVVDGAFVTRVTGRLIDNEVFLARFASSG